MTRTEIAQRFVEAQRTRSASAIDAVSAVLADDAVFVTRRGTITGKKAIVDRLRSGPAAGMRGGPFIRRILARRWQRRAQQHGGGGMLSQVEFEPPTESGDVVTMKAKLPPNPMISSLTLTFTFDSHDRLMRIEQHVA